VGTVSSFSEGEAAGGRSSPPPRARFRIPHKPLWRSQGKLYLWHICWVQSIKFIVIVKHPAQWRNLYSCWRNYLQFSKCCVKNPNRMSCG